MEQVCVSADDWFKSRGHAVTFVVRRGYHTPAKPI